MSECVCVSDCVSGCGTYTVLCLIHLIPLVVSPYPIAGDEIVDVTVIDDGWMEGRVKRTGDYGMLPSNYVEKQ